jgi:hypothetical protein
VLLKINPELTLYGRIIVHDKNPDWSIAQSACGLNPDDAT